MRWDHDVPANISVFPLGFSVLNCVGDSPKVGDFSDCLSVSFPSDNVSPQELECLQDHLEDLLVDCREVVGNLTELESEVGER